MDMGNGTIHNARSCTRVWVWDISCARCLRCSHSERTYSCFGLLIFMFMFPFSCTTITGSSILLSCMSAVAPGSSFTLCLQSEACAHAQRGIQAQFWPAAHLGISRKSWVMCFWIQLPSVVSVGRVNIRARRILGVHALLCNLMCKYSKRAVARYKLSGNHARKVGEHLMEYAKHLRPMLVEFLISE